MPRRLLAPIMTVKHYVHQTPLNLVAGAVQTLPIAEAVVAPATANSFSVSEGSIIKAIYVEMWVTGQGSSGTTGTVTAIIEKRPSGVGDPTFANLANLGAYDNKKNIFYATQGNFGSVANGPNPFNIFRGWIKIPKGKQRMGIGDEIDITLSANVQTLQMCGFFTYKEYK